jgi:actin-like ATPase involved in cell morphogenesis
VTLKDGVIASKEIGKEIMNYVADQVARLAQDENKAINKSKL